MDDEIKEVLLKILETSFNGKKTLAFNAINAFKADLEKYNVPADKAIEFIDNLTGLFVSIDKNISKEEYEIYNYATSNKISEEQFIDLVNKAKEEKTKEKTLRRLSKFDFDSKSHLLVYATVLMSADGRYKKEEIDIIDRIMSIHNF